MALHASAPWVAAASFCCGAGSALFGTYCGTAMQQQVPPEMLARVSSLSTFPAYGVGVIDGPLAAAFGTSAVFAVGAVYGLASSAVVLSLRSVRAVRWRGKDEPAVNASSPPREAPRRRLAAPPP
jgi:MFS family permease